ncbi:MAG: DUF1573 domain-containing protein [Bacteroides sp.]|nr:DUF1573 domain-containing protein [Bacteroides sp.]
MRIPSLLFIATLALSLGISGCTETPEKKAKVKGEDIWFEEVLHDYGEIPEDGDGSWTFVFKNLGDEPIIINRVRSTCGCTVPAWPREPIEPKATGEITVEYNTAQAGSFFKSLYVYSSAPNSPVKLQIKGKVIPNQE